MDIRTKNLPGRRDTWKDPETGQGEPDVFGEWQGSMHGHSEYVRGAGGRIGSLLSVLCGETSR